jgi:hypothetical protein
LKIGTNQLFNSMGFQTSWILEFDSIRPNLGDPNMPLDLFFLCVVRFFKSSIHCIIVLLIP